MQPLGILPNGIKVVLNLEVQIDPHTLERAEERGSNEHEIKDVINNGTPIPAKHNRLGKVKVHDF